MPEVVDAVSNKDGGTFLKRVLYDMTFFVWVGVLLFNVITGLVVDAFGALRMESAERKDILDNQCFICGFTRSQYDDVGLPTSAPSFDKHCRNGTFQWNRSAQNAA